MRLHRIPKSVYFLMALTALVAARLVYESNRDAADSNRVTTLKEGWYHVESIEDSLTMLVKPESDQQAKWMRIRLASIKIEEPEPAESDPRIPLALSKLVATSRIYVRFDRTRFATDMTPLAYVFQDDMFINAELVKLGVAQPDLIPGNSSKLQRQISRAAELAKLDDRELR